MRSPTGHSLARNHCNLPLKANTIDEHGHSPVFPGPDVFRTPPADHWVIGAALDISRGRAVSIPGTLGANALTIGYLRLGLVLSDSVCCPRRNLGNHYGPYGDSIYAVIR